MPKFITDIFAAKEGRKGAERAAAAQERSAALGIEESRRQFDASKEVLDPYTQAGQEALGGFDPYRQAGAGALGGLESYAQAGLPALQQQQAALGLQGPEAQQAYIQQLEDSPYMQAMMQQGENAMLQNASATGGLRGGNTQAALAQFRPQMMQQYMDQNYNRLGGLAAQGGNVGQFLAGQGQAATGNLASIGQASAAGQSAAGLQTGANIANLLGRQGQAQAGAHIAASNARGQMWNAGGNAATDVAKAFLGGF